MTAPVRSRRRLLGGVVVAAAACALVLTACAPPSSGPGVSTSSPRTPQAPVPTAAAATASPSSTPVPPPRAEPRGEPEHVIVTTGDREVLVDARIVPAALDDQGILAPPTGVVGWYSEEGWPKPGYPGASILAGHINTRANGPDTFARLPEVRPGAKVRVTYSSGDEVDFVVTRSQPVPKTETPKDDSIWDAGNPHPLLRLITCDPTTPLRSGHYLGNWVVWADARS